MFPVRCDSSNRTDPRKPPRQMGYGSRALRILDSFYSGQLLNLDEAQKKNGAESFVDASRVPEVGPSHLATHWSVHLTLDF